MFSFHTEVFTGDNANSYGKGFVAAADPSSLPRILCQHVWSPHVWESGRRHSSEWLGCELLVLDYDDPIYSIDEMRGRLNHYRIGHIMGTTKSHLLIKNGKRCERYRVVIPLARPIHSIEVYKHVYAKALQYPTLRGADPACSDVARWYAPCTKLASLMWGPGIPLPGVPTGLDDDQVLEWMRFQRPRRERANVVALPQDRRLNRTVDGIVARGLQPGSRNRDLFIVSCEVARKFGTSGLRAKVEELLHVSGSGLPEAEIEAVIKKAAKRAAS